jgi:hypothetical protein
MEWHLYTTGGMDALEWMGWRKWTFSAKMALCAQLNPSSPPALTRSHDVDLLVGSVLMLL